VELKRGIEFEFQLTDRNAPEKDKHFYADGEKSIVQDIANKLGKQLCNLRPSMGKHTDFTFGLYLPGTPKTPFESSRNFLTYKLRARVRNDSARAPLAQS